MLNTIIKLFQKPKNTGKLLNGFHKLSKSHKATQEMKTESGMYGESNMETYTLLYVKYGNGNFWESAI